MHAYVCPHPTVRSRALGDPEGLELCHMEDDRRIWEYLVWRKVSSSLLEEALNLISFTRGQGGTSRWKTSRF